MTERRTIRRYVELSLHEAALYEQCVRLVNKHHYFTLFAITFNVNSHRLIG